LRWFWLCFGCGILLSALAFGAFALTGELDAMRLGLHGWIALIAGIVLSFAVGAALMALLFASSRRGYDEGGSFDDRSNRE
jgi:hypothetical protein